MSFVNAGPSGFQHTPVLKFVFYTSTASSLAYLYSHKMPAVSALLSHPVPAFLKQQLAFGSIMNTLQALGLLYQFRIFERRMGSAKFAALTLLVTACCFCGQLLASWYRPGIALESGPFGLVFSLFAPYILEVPALLNLPFLGITLSEKHLLAAGGLQVSALATCPPGPSSRLASSITVIERARS